MITHLIVLALATIYLATAVTQHDGPGQIFFRLRCWLSPSGVATPGSLGELASCYTCSSMWIAIAIYFVPTAWLLPLAAAGVAVLVKRLCVES